MTRSCLVCGKLLADGPVPGTPFCSERCRLIDLGQWLEGAYRIPASEVPAPTRDADASGDEADTGAERGSSR